MSGRYFREIASADCPATRQRLAHSTSRTATIPGWGDAGRELGGRDEAAVGQLSIRSQPESVRRHIGTGADGSRRGSAMSIRVKCHVVAINSRVIAVAFRIVRPQKSGNSA
jgi:hypothetical protein